MHVTAFTVHLQLQAGVLNLDLKCITLLKVQFRLNNSSPNWDWMIKCTGWESYLCHLPPLLRPLRISRLILKNKQLSQIHSYSDLPSHYALKRYSALNHKFEIIKIMAIMAFISYSFMLGPNDKVGQWEYHRHPFSTFPDW